LNNKVTVKIKKLHPDAVIPQYAHKGDAGFDLVAVKDVVIAPGETKMIPTGLAFEVPSGYEMQIRPRSGISSKTSLRVPNAPGTVDAGYRAEVNVLINNTHTTSNIFSLKAKTLDSKYKLVEDACMEGSYLIRKGDRIAQGVIQKLPEVTITEVDELSDSERGLCGFGSSGVRQEVIS
jgi:dUTP pyrophosphatase